MPTAVVLYRVAMQALFGNLLPRLVWKPREFNRWADDLAAGRTESFDLSKEINVDTCFGEIDWLFQEHSKAEAQYAEIRNRVKLAKARARQST